MPKPNMSALRRAYTEELRTAGPVARNPRILKAFAAVARERFLPPAPWTIHGLVPYRTTDAARLYHNVLVGIDPKRKLNSGSPALWAYLFDQLDLAPGERVYQVGAGTGYFTAILAELVGRRGRVLAVEHDARLARMARANLKTYPNVEVIAGDGAAIDPGEADVIVVFAGGTHPPALWLDRLVPGGRLLMPLVAENGGGFMLHAVKAGAAFRAKALTAAYFFLAAGFRDTRAAKTLARIMKRQNGKLPRLRQLHPGRAPAAQRKQAFYTMPTCWLSAR